MRTSYHARITFNAHKVRYSKGKELVSKNFKTTTFDTVINTMDKEEILKKYRGRLCLRAGLSSMDIVSKIDITDVKLLNFLKYE